MATALFVAGAMFTSCATDPEEAPVQPDETQITTRAFGDKSPIVSVYETEDLAEFIGMRKKVLKMLASRAKGESLEKILAETREIEEYENQRNNR